MANKQQQAVQYPLSKNIIKQGELFGFPRRNWIEGLAFGGIAITIINHIPFTDLARVVFIVLWGGAATVFGIRGIKNRSVTEMIIDEIKYIKNRRKTHLRGPEYVRTKKEFKEYHINHASLAGQLIVEARTKLLDFAYKHSEISGSESNSKNNR